MTGKGFAIGFIAIGLGLTIGAGAVHLAHRHEMDAAALCVSPPRPGGGTLPPSIAAPDTSPAHWALLAVGWALTGAGIRRRK